jgi:hypothetical protein
LSETAVRLEIGFEGGQILRENVSAPAADALEAALKEGREPVHVLESEDGRYLVALGRVLYLKRVTRESKVGF